MHEAVSREEDQEAASQEVAAEVHREEEAASEVVEAAAFREGEVLPAVLIRHSEAGAHLGVEGRECYTVYIHGALRRCGRHGYPKKR